MKEKHWNEVKVALTYYKGIIERFKKKKIEEEGALEDFFGDLDEELSLIKRGFEIVERKGGYVAKEGFLFQRALNRYKDALLQIKNQINELFNDLPNKTNKIDLQLELIEETDRKLYA